MRLFCLMGKSASGKDSIYKELLKDEELRLEPFVIYTTRPIREGEEDGREYHFTDIEGMRRLEEEGKVIESRVYHTVHGDWYYFTVDEGTAGKKDCLIIGTLEVYNKIKVYYGEDSVIPLYINVDDGVRLERALKRERAQSEPRYAEMCRRFLADDADFSAEKLREAGIDVIYQNDDLNECLSRIKERIRRG
ncbi:MAG: guanylate kinase [Lachnospiraceae bacterium]|nr:guanylate kinase [Lachnospiraceae bacterium]